jgi:YafQ family addiction module toxin component
MYALEVTESVGEKFKKLSKKDKVQMEAIDCKILQILENPHHFKPLRFSMAGTYRVHVMKSFVLIYCVDEERKTVTILDYDHHDKIYKH